MTAILMVCLGNICRSPLAEAAMRMTTKRAGLDMRVDSAGTAAYHIGNAPDQRSQQVAMQMANIDMSGYKARQVKTTDFDDFDYIFAMDQQNLHDLLAIKPEDSRAIVKLLCNDSAVDDPYYGDMSDFEDVWDQVLEASEAFTNQL